MPVDILMPQLSPTMTEGRLAGWNVKEGDNVNPGDVIAEIETDKATMEVEATDEGIIHKILGKSGDDIAVGTPIAILREEDEKVPAGYKPAAAAPEVAAEETTAEVAAPAAKTAPAATTTVQRQASLAPQINQGTVVSADINVSPVAKRLAEENGINLEAVNGSGPKGRIVKKDVEQAIKGGVIMRKADERLDNAPMRRAIATRLTESKQQIPHFYLTADVKMDALLSARKQLNDAAEGKYKITVNDFIIKACAMAMRKNPNANASWYDDAVIRYGNVDVSVAVAIDDGLITPIVTNADMKDVIEISKDIKSLAAQAREGALKPEQYQGGGFTISNLGMYGVKEFQAIVNPPQGAILAVGAAAEQVVVENGDMTTATVMTINMSVDHRVIDGAVGAEFLRDIKFFLENPLAMMV